MTDQRLTISLLLLVLLVSCSQTPPQDERYVSEIDSWHQKRIERLKSETGWLTLTGLFWLDPGENTFGSDSDNDIIFPGDGVPNFLGTFVLEEEAVTLVVHPEAEITVDGQRVESMRLVSDVEGDPTLMELGSLNWFVIRRDDRFGIRLRDRNHPNLKSFEGIDRYPVDSSWNIRATLVAADSPLTIDVPNVLGTVNKDPSPGRLDFVIDGKQYSLYPTGERESRRWFVIFADETNGDETYGAGRFLYIDSADSTGHTMIDFNQAYNPPCAFTPYATCPLPPAVNRLRLPVTAGEKSYKGYEH